MTVGRIIENREGNKVERFCDLHIPFLNKERFFIVSTPKERAKEGSPVFEVYGLYGRVGGIWNRTSNQGERYKSMSIQTMDRTLYFAIFEAREVKEVKGGTLTHNIVYSIPKKNQAFQSDTSEFEMVSDEEIPF